MLEKKLELHINDMKKNCEFQTHYHSLVPMAGYSLHFADFTGAQVGNPNKYLK